MSNEVVGRATRMGWKRRRSGEKFEIVIELEDAPGWPLSVVWSSEPVTLSLKTAQGEQK